MRLDLAEDPSVMQMAETLGIREEYVVGCLHKVWCWASRQCHDGSVTGVTIMSLERVTGVTGFVVAMRDAGWIEESVDDHGKPSVVFPKWENWLSNSAKKRLMDAKRQQNHRKNVGHDAVTKVSRKQRDKNVTTGEERRGQKNRDTNVSLSESFDAWWSHYPKKVGKEDARKAYTKALAKFSTANTELAAADLLDASLPRFQKLREREPQYVPHAATWLNSGGWLDDIDSIAPKAKSGALVGPGQVYDPNADFGSDF